MKQKLLKTMLLLCALLVGSGSVWAGTVTLTQSSLGLTGTYTSNTEKTIDGITYVYTDLQKNSESIQAKASTGVIYNTTAFPGDITSVAITHSGTARPTTISGSADGTNWTQVSTGSGSITGDFSGKGYKYFKITRGSNAAYWTQIVITYSAPACATPTFSPAAGTYTSTQSVSISTETAGATIYYTTDGTTPSSSNGTAYSSAITVSSTQTIKAIAVKDGNSDSEVATAAYTITSAVATTTTISASGITNTDVYVSTTAGAFAATVKDNVDATIAAAAVTWSSSDTDVATIDPSTGALTLVAAGSTTITASYAGVTDTYQPSSDTYELTVTSSAPQPTSVTFNMNYEWLGSSNGSNLASGDLPVVKSQDNVTVTITDGTSTRPRGDSDYIRVYNGSTITFEAPTGYDVTGITFTEGGTGTWNAPSVDSGTLSGKTWSGSASSVVFTLSGTCFISKAVVTLAVQKTANDLALTSSSAVALEKTSVTPNPTSTITWTTSSTGAMTFTSSNTSVATVTSAGVITAVGAGEATITFSQAADEDYKASTDKTVTVTVSDSRSACASSIDLPTVQKTLTVGDIDDFTATSTKNAGFTGTVVYSYSTSDASIVDLDEETFSAEAPGTANITVTATPTGGNADNYKPASQVVAVKVNAANSISLDQTSKTQAYSAGEFNITATVPTANYDGTVSAESSNTAVATVSAEGTTITVTPVAVGSATITVTSGIGTYYPATAQATCAVTVSAPEGKTTAPSTDVTYKFNFTVNSEWEFPVGSSKKTTESTNYTADGKTITVGGGGSGNGYYFNTDGYLLMGKSGATITLPAFDKPVTQIDVEGTSAASTSVKQNIYVESNAVSNETEGAKNVTNEYEINSEYQAAGTIYTLKVTNAYNTQIASIVVHMYQAPTSTVTLNKYGYATYCSVNPMDFTTTEGYTAWRVSNVSGDGTITFNKITGAIKGGQGVLLYNKDADGENKTNVTVTFADGDTEFTSSENKLIGTTAPTYVADDESYFGLSGKKFVPVNAGTVPAGKALLPYIPESGIKSFTFIFNDSETGVTETRTVSREVVETIFDLNGRRLSQPQKGINIINGRKVVVK